MRLRNLVVTFAFSLSLSLVASTASAQAAPTAGRALGISAFGGITGTYTGLGGGRNLGITAGVDVGLRPFFGVRPFLEGRGTYPMDGGRVDAQKSALGGARLERTLTRRINVYGDILIGRGKLDYENGGFPNPSGGYLYISSTTNVVSPGAGVEYRLSGQFSALADVQFQHWDTPAASSGAIWAKPLTLGLRYSFNFNRRGYATR